MCGFVGGCGLVCATDVNGSLPVRYRDTNKEPFSLLKWLLNAIRQNVEAKQFYLLCTQKSQIRIHRHETRWNLVYFTQALDNDIMIMKYVTSVLTLKLSRSSVRLLMVKEGGSIWTQHQKHTFLNEFFIFSISERILRWNLRLPPPRLDHDWGSNRL